jgi:TRAP-type C4-dicarboxylate transport system substrate-binding protein
MRLAPFALALALFASAGSARATTIVRVSTTFPASSDVAHALQIWSKTLGQKTNGDVLLKIVFKNALDDDEASMVRVVRDCDGTSTKTSSAPILACDADATLVPVRALSPFEPSVGALIMPGLFGSPKQLDEALRLFGPRFEQRLAKSRLITVGWVDMGVTRVFWTGASGDVAAPSDFKSKTTIAFPGDASEAALATVDGAGLVTKTPARVLGALGGAAVLLATAYESEQRQWSAPLGKVVDVPYARSVGAVVVSTAMMDRLSSGARSAFLETGRAAMATLSTTMTTKDDLAFGRFVVQRAVVHPSTAQAKDWVTHAHTIRELLTPSVGSDLVAKLEELSGVR